MSDLAFDGLKLLADRASRKNILVSSARLQVEGLRLGKVGLQL
ncbi:hypothetical protein [Saccharolobus caldissimus]|nr:hypothetical protein [Saccharolobus caldissimus]